MNGVSGQSDTSPAALAEEITRNSASTLWFVGRFLPLTKRRLFEASYATMRVIDDFVDDDFLNRSADIRENTRVDAEAFVTAWSDQAEAALGQSGTLTPEHPHASIFTALSEAATGADIPYDPWANLARSMIFDVREQTLETWEDFEAYCEGATVAPAAVFLYVLQAVEQGEREGLVAGLTGPQLADQARDMAIFCYLTHIRRDFAKDAGRGGQLVTVPRNLLAANGLSKEALAEAPEACVPLLEEIGRHAELRRIAAREMAGMILPNLAPAERTILDTLLSIYEAMHRNLNDQPLPDQNLVSRWTDALRAKAIKAFGNMGP